MRPIIFIFSVLFLFGFLSCTDEQRRRMELTPTAYGEVDGIFFISDEYIWKTAVGDTFKKYFEALYPVTPQPEPLFDIRFISSEKFNKVHRTHRTIIIMADLSDTANTATQMTLKAIGKQNGKRAIQDDKYRLALSYDRWAAGQLVIYWFAPNRQLLIESIRRDYDQIIKKINTHDAVKLNKQVFAEGKNQNIEKYIKDSLRFQISIPKNFEIAYKDSSTVWIFDDTDKASSNILMHVLKGNYLSIHPDTLIKIRNQLSKKYFSSWAEGSYMTVDKENLPLFFEEIMVLGRKGLQCRGLWKMEKDFMGGPFASYMILDSNQIIFLDAFVYAPGKKKRFEMRKLDMIFSGFSALD
jgi:hypothetical protein